VLKCGSGSKMSLGWKTALRRSDVQETSGWILKVVDISGEPLSSLDTCHHSGAGQILTITDVPRFSTYQSLQKESRGSEVDQRVS